MTRRKRTVAVSSSVVTRPASARSVVAQPSRRSRRRRNQQIATTNYSPSPSSLALHPDVRAYARVLSDPFVHPPVKLGFGCLVPSQLTTLTFRSFYSSGADGMVGVMLIPGINSNDLNGSGGVYTTNSSAADSPAFVQHGWFNRSAAAALYEEVRIVSCGLRLTPMVPGTGAPGAAMVASIPSANYLQLNAIPLNQMINNPLFKWGYASSGATVVGRPVDPDSFNFKHNLLTGWSWSEDAPFTIPYVIMNGLQPHMSVLIEAVLHVEGIYGPSPFAQAQLATSLTSAPAESGLHRIFGSVESMWNTVSRLLPSASTVRTAFSLANTLLNGPDPPARQRYLPSSVQGQLLP